MNKVISFLKKPYRFACVYALILVLTVLSSAMVEFILPHGTVKVEYNEPVDASETFLTKTGPQDGLDENGYGYWEQENIPVDSDDDTGLTYTARGYRDENIEIRIDQYRRLHTDIYVADIRVRDVKYLKAGFAENTFGVHITENTSDIAQRHQAILAINGDYFGYHDESFVLRNGISYRDSARTDDLYEDLVIGYDGSFTRIEEVRGEMEKWQQSWQIFGFGPTLLWGGEVVTGETTEVARCKASNPRTCIGRYETDEDGWLHYCFVTSDGRTATVDAVTGELQPLAQPFVTDPAQVKTEGGRCGYSAGLSLYQLAGFMQELGCVDGYNMDGGGSATMVFCGQVINLPTNGNYGYKERGVSDIVYIGY